ncbi:nicotinate (nicotinamide) nucleotide adenylyltransferase [uncultured Alloprevotella sp.]|uniref:nicotinate (nicotinamide) nucleotide adenylyltransferase n=1 Tax=uncultured Alloprevotella sp. TaxID=1283315 RepID=UPI00261AD0FC|nr:nicotinate (nicotinamide) nucleotide adenylyltransferase [uncultured Alloprevotella sp.]
MKRIGIFGGSFNPIHKGHIHIGLKAIADKEVDEIHYLVSPQNPLKCDQQLLDEQLRFRLTIKALADYPLLKASDFEFHLPRPSFTWKTMDALRQHYPADQLVLLIGADNWLLFDRWANHAQLLANYQFLIYPRDGYEVAAADLPANVRLLDAPIYPYSSTMIRQAVQTGGDIAEMVPDAIKDDVKRLYGT